MHAPVTWAQRNNLVFLTIDVGDCKDPELKIEEDRLYFCGVGGSDKNTYEADIKLYGKINPETSKHQVQGRNIQVVLMRAEPGPYWPRLLKDSAKVHWLKVDFNRWKDDDDSEDEGAPGNDMNLESMMKQMGGLGSGAGDGSKPNMDDLSDSSLSDSDAEPMADEPMADELPAVEPAAMEPPTVEPPVAESAAAEPPAVEPAAMEPPTVEPPAAEPAAAEPPAAEPPAAEPSAAEPSAVEPPVDEQK